MQAAKWIITAFTLSLSACASHTAKISGANPFTATGVPTNLDEAAKAAQLPMVRLVFSGHVGGEVGECGCAVNPKGGADRRLNFLNSERAGMSSLRPTNRVPSLVLDAGNALFPATRLDRGQASLQRARAEFLLKAHALMGVAAENVGTLDLAAGLGYLKNAAAKAGVHLVSVNLVDASGKLAFEPSRRMTLPNGVWVTILGISAGGTLPDGMRTLDPAATLRDEMARIPDGDLVVVLSDLGQAQDRELAASLKRAAVFVGGRDSGSIETALQPGSALVVQPQIQGEQWGVLDIAWRTKATGWVSPSLSARYATNWERLKAEGQDLGEVKEYLPGDVNAKALYEYRLVDMGAVYAAPKNELTADVVRLSKSAASR
ncbi:MAG: hypothetical protein JST16_03260 [Bdellovibrionales bacterium]|nr:hypothetical protein [Bdellovibrionales bacterium]